MLPVVYGENMFDDFLENGFFVLTTRCSVRTAET